MLIERVKCYFVHKLQLVLETTKYTVYEIITFLEKSTITTYPRVAKLI